MIRRSLYMPLWTTVADTLDVMLALEALSPTPTLPFLVIAIFIVVGKTLIVFC
jgi:hypothetical protein